MSTAETVVAQTQLWLDLLVVGQNFCPFARRELERGSVRFEVSTECGLEQSLLQLMAEVQRLNNDSSIETTLLIFRDGFAEFDDYLQMVELANELLVAQDYEGVYQLASFHPDYCFADADPNDPANYTNRSPYPTLHLLRESSLEQALSHVENPAEIPERNIRVARELEAEQLQAICYMIRGNID